jgi:hypothetical protein
VRTQQAKAQAPQRGFLSDLHRLSVVGRLHAALLLAGSTRWKHSLSACFLEAALIKEGLQGVDDLSGLAFAWTCSLY